MNLALGTVLTRQFLVILAVLLVFLMLGVKGQEWRDQRKQALVAAREDATKIETAVEKTLAVPGPKLTPLIAYRQATSMIADEAAENRRQSGCDWQRDKRLTLIFDASGAPLREPTDKGATGYPGSSIPGVMRSELTTRDIQAGPSRLGASLGIHAKDADCLTDGTAIGVLVRFNGGAFTALRMISFDWVGYGVLLFYAVGALLIFELLAKLVAWQFNVALNRRISRITAVLRTVEENEFTDRVPCDGGSEFAVLGEEINAMIARLDLTHRYFSDLNRFVAHNLRSPIIVARALVENLARTPGADTSSMLSEIDLQLLKLNQQCNKLLAQAKPGPVRSDPVDMAAVVTRQVDDIFSYLAQDRDMTIDLYLAPTVVAVPVATQELIIDNLLDNALKFGEKGTSVRVNLEMHNGKARLCVVNRGPSVSPDNFAAIFKRGVTTGGHGLGLYAVHTAVTLHGGDVVALPEEGGFRILVTLPLAQTHLA